MSEPGVTRTPECRCLGCGRPINRAGRVEHGAPSPGDLSVCIRCGAVMMLADDLTLRGMTDAEIESVTSDRETMDDLAKVVTRVHLVRHSVG